MKRIYLLLVTIFLAISFVTAQAGICIDFDEPSEPTNLEVTSSGTNIILTWDPATDVPDCSGVESYNIYIDANLIATTSSDTLTFTDADVAYGTYSYSVYAIDKVAHNSGLAIANDVVLSDPTTDEGDSSDTDDSSSSGSTRVSGGGGSSSYVCYEEWQCGTWSACANEMQTRTCTDTKKCGTTINKPITSQTCTGESDNKEPVIISSDEDKSFIAGITGAVVGTLGTRGTIGVFGLIFGLIGVFVFVKIRKRRKN